MKNGNYAIYKGIEYKFTSANNNQVLLKSNDSSDLNMGFSESIHHKGTYLKEVPKSDLTEIYSIFTIATYKGQDFLVRSEESGKLCIESSGNEDLVSALEFDYTEDRGIYRKWVNKSVVTSIREEKQPIR